MPSTLIRDHCLDVETKLMEFKWEFCMAQAEESLDELCRKVILETYILDYKKAYGHGQRQGTKSPWKHSPIALLDRDALTNNAEGEGRQKLSWIWMAPGTGKSSSLEHVQEGLVHNAGLRNAFYSKKKCSWKEHAEMSIEGTNGSTWAFALRQVLLWMAMHDNCAQSWSSMLRWLTLGLVPDGDVEMGNEDYCLQVRDVFKKKLCTVLGQERTGGKSTGLIVVAGNELTMHHPQVGHTCLRSSGNCIQFKSWWPYEVLKVCQYLQSLNICCTDYYGHMLVDILESVRPVTGADPLQIQLSFYTRTWIYPNHHEHAMKMYRRMVRCIAVVGIGNITVKVSVIHNSDINWSRTRFNDEADYADWIRLNCFKAVVEAMEGRFVL
ncbi:hypothetical protein ARMGADRAFT_1031215 [Armillaria gallica]|uniref:Uncharacterized protein n=1 Tax=Armillaria gallica TaxID=47427 RepID=A0A2H3DE03_ARMGA|nr:hypothetical protein ARMGADRAFT_1031215 [Armillaria gallica]